VRLASQNLLVKSRNLYGIRKFRAAVPARGATMTGLSDQPQSAARTFRIRGIPLSVTEVEFRRYLEGLLGYGDFGLSFVSDGCTITATVTPTYGEPAALSKCAPGNDVDLPYPGTEDGLLADCDFFGITPLYSAEEPTVE